MSFDKNDSMLYLTYLLLHRLRLLLLIYCMYPDWNTCLNLKYFPR